MMPEDVLRGKNIRYKMSERADLGDEDDNPAEDFFRQRSYA